MLWTSLGYYLPAALALVAVVYAVVRADIDHHQRYIDDLRHSTMRELARFGSQLQYNVNSNVSLSRGLASAIAADPNGWDQDRFAKVAQQLMWTKTQLRNIAAAPDMVIRLIYPVESNKTSLGFNLLNSPAQRDMAIAARDRHKTVVTGPVNLVQGGLGLIARIPIFYNDAEGNETFWGLISAVMDLDKLYSESGLLDDDLQIDIAIAKIVDTETGTPFFGDASVTTKDHVTYLVPLGDEVWSIMAVPKAGWTGVPEDQVALRLQSLLIVLFVVGPLIWAGYLAKQRNLVIRNLEEREDRLATLSLRLQMALDASRIGVWEYIPSTGELIWDQRMREIFCVAADQPRCDYQDWIAALHPDDRREAEQVFARAIAAEEPYSTEFRIVTPVGTVEHIRAYGIVYWTHAGSKRIVGANWSVTDDVRLKEELKAAHLLSETQNRRLEEAGRTLAYQSIHDALTELPNRRFLEQFLEEHPKVEMIALLHVDLDRFKAVNDTFGHGAGDEVLKITARLLKTHLQPGEIAIRIGGDEFIIVAPAADPEGRSRALGTAVIEALIQPMPIASTELVVGASIGVAIQGPGATETQQLLNSADVALYEAKKLGRNRIAVFNEAMREARDRMKLLSDDLAAALENSEFIPFFQPQFDARTLEIVGVEALVRWQHPRQGLLTPDKFLHQAQALNHVADIDAIMLEKSLFEFLRWQANGFSIGKISVNISAKRLKDARLIDRLSRLSMPAGALSFELLESISFDEGDPELMQAIQSIKSFGIDIEIDDFGSGHASILSLLELAPRRLKIDRKLIAPIVDSQQQQRLVSSIIEMGRLFGVEIIAEGVETMEHARILRDLGCHSLQGYALAMPMSASAFLDLLRDRQLRGAETNTGVRA
jgi:diguanylate cyclase (GGDEF)-like protein